MNEITPKMLFNIALIVSGKTLRGYAESIEVTATAVHLVLNGNSTSQYISEKVEAFTKEHLAILNDYLIDFFRIN